MMQGWSWAPCSAKVGAKVESFSAQRWTDVAYSAALERFRSRPPWKIDPVDLVSKFFCRKTTTFSETGNIYILSPFLASRPTLAF